MRAMPPRVMLRPPWSWLLVSTQASTWSCKLAPTPGRACTGAMPCLASSAGSPMPDNIRICGLPYAPADRITSRRAGQLGLALDFVAHADGALAVHFHTGDVGAGDDGEVGAVAHRVEKAGRDAAAPAVADGELVGADAFRMVAVEVVRQRQAGLARA